MKWLTSTCCEEREPQWRGFCIFFSNWTLSVHVWPEQDFRRIGILNRYAQLRHSKVKYKYFVLQGFVRAVAVVIAKTPYCRNRWNSSPVFSTCASDSIILAFWVSNFKAGSIQILFLTVKALANEDTLLRTHCYRHKCFPVCLGAQHLLRTQILCPARKKGFWFCSETFCVRNKCFPVCAAQETSWATMCPHLPGTLVSSFVDPISPLLLRAVTHKAILYSRHDD